MLVTNVVNTQDTKEQALCATYWCLGLIQVPHKAPVYIAHTHTRTHATHADPSHAHGTWSRHGLTSMATMRSSGSTNPPPSASASAARREAPAVAPAVVPAVTPAVVAPPAYRASSSSAVPRGTMPGSPSRAARSWGGARWSVRCASGPRSPGIQELEGV
eukprot:1181010-Prorocentrum_minimum.AAC.2